MKSTHKQATKNGCYAFILLWNGSFRQIFKTNQFHFNQSIWIAEPLIDERYAVQWSDKKRWERDGTLVSTGNFENGKKGEKNGGKEAMKKTTALKMQLMLGQNWADLINTPLHEQTNAATQQLSCGGTSPEYEAWYFRNLKIWNFLHRICLVLGFMCVFQYCFRCVCFNNCSAYILKQSDNGKVKTSDANLSNSVQLCCKIW